MTYESLIHKLKAKTLTRYIGKKRIVYNISLEVNSSEIVGLLGPNGAGKTTTFYMICGLTDLSEGSVILDDIDITNEPLSIRAKRGIGYLPQESSIFKDLSVEDNLRIATEAINMDRLSANRRIEELLEMFNISTIRDRVGFRLSGGERRRVEIARSLVGNPKFLLLDEPFAGVDPIAVLDIQNIVRQLADMRIGILITDHNVRETLGICQRAYVMRNGEMLANGTSDEIAMNKEVQKYYLGEGFVF